jgi:hypothetical protein
MPRCRSSGTAEEVAASDDHGDLDAAADTAAISQGDP